MVEFRRKGFYCHILNFNHCLNVEIKLRHTYAAEVSKSAVNINRDK